MGGINTMGTGTGNALFFGLYGGEIVIEYDDKKELIKVLEELGLDPDDREKRKRTKGKNEGNTVHYYTFNNIEGMLTNVYLNETDWGEFMNVELTNGGQKYVLSLGDVFSRHAKDFIRRMESIDLEEEVAIGTWSMEGDNGRTYSGVRMYQDGEKIDYVLETEDLPEPIKRKKGKKVEWDYTDQEEFLYEKLTSWMGECFKPNVKKNDDDGGGDEEDGGKKKKKKKKNKKKNKDKSEESPKKSKGLTGKGKSKGKGSKGDDSKKAKKKMPWDKK